MIGFFPLASGLDRRGPNLYRARDPHSHQPCRLAAIAATIPGNVGFENKRAEMANAYVWLDHATVAKLKAMRGRGEDYSIVILRLAEATSSRRFSRAVRRILA